MGIKKDLTGKIFGRLTVIEQDMEKYAEKHQVFWKCQCICGNYKSIRTYDLTGGKIQSCGCLRNERVREAVGSKLEGKRFGRLIVLKQVESIREDSGMLRTAWFCKCDCGNKVIVKTINLKAGDTKSCGCLNLDRLKEKRKDLTGMRFGKLIPFEIDEEKMKNRKEHDTRAYWKCKCDCGNITTVSSSLLIQGSTMSCGCICSHGEVLIANALNSQSEWVYEKEKTFDDLLGNDQKTKLRFDFAIYENNELLFLIEFQGKQHFEPVDFFGGEERFLLQKEYDKKKEDYCLKNKIPLIIIRYDEDKKINLNFIKEKYYESKALY